MANITILTVGSRGDFQPYCAIALGLMKRGHQVTIASSPNFASFADRLGIPFSAISGDFQKLLKSLAGLNTLEGKRTELIEEDLLWQQLLDAREAI